MAQEIWRSSGYTHDRVKFAETTMVWDTKLKKIVDIKTKLLIPLEELERRKSVLPPPTVYR